VDPAPLAENEKGRLFAVQELHLFDSAPEERFDRLVQLAARLSDAPLALMSVVSERTVFFKSAYGTKQVGVELGQPSRDFWFCSHVVAFGQPLVIADARADRRFAALEAVRTHPGIVAYAGVPIRAQGGEAVGALAVLDVAERRFAEAELEVLKELARLIEAELSPLPYVATDPLTGVLNGRTFGRMANRLLAFGDRRGLSSVLLCVDVAGLGNINSAYGEEVGDELLAEAAQLLEQTVRGCDLVGRIDSDTFGVLLVGGDARTAQLVLDRITAGTLAHNRASGRAFGLTFHLGGAVHQPGEPAEVARLLVTAAPARRRHSAQ
jgi:diguanylate cyclase (GGDEF)-like protein